MKRNECDARQLDLFLQERLPAEQHRELEAHLSLCAACRSRLDDLAGGAPWWSEVRQHLGGDGAAAMSRFGRTATPRNNSVNLYFLQPSDRAASLGRLGAYEVLEVLGRGGFGIVLKAFDPALHRPVAIKVLAPEFAVSVAARKRFAREAQAAAAVSHDHVVPVHAVDADATPPYLVMSFIHGQSLQQRLDAGGPLQLDEILRIGIQTAAGLAAAHAQGLVHRDIKPANIMLENGLERVRITDFGLARAVDDASVSQSGALAGTPQYMSPEQATCDAVDQRSDLFALGSTLYAMCTGLAPFRGSPCLAVLKQVCESEPAAIRSLNPAIPAWLEGVVRKLHAKNPGQRFASAAEVADLLERCLAHLQQPDRQPLPAEAAHLAELVPAATRRRRAKDGALAALFVACTGGLACLLWPRPQLELVPHQAADLAWYAVARGISEEDAFRDTQAVQAGLNRLRYSLTASESPDVSILDNQLQDASQLARRLAQSLQNAATPELDPVAAELATVRTRLTRLEQSGDFPRTSVQRPKEGEYP